MTVIAYGVYKCSLSDGAVVLLKFICEGQSPPMSITVQSRLSAVSLPLSAVSGVNGYYTNGCCTIYHPLQAGVSDLTVWHCATGFLCPASLGGWLR